MQRKTSAAFFKLNRSKPPRRMDIGGTRDAARTNAPPKKSVKAFTANKYNIFGTWGWFCWIVGAGYVIKAA